MSGENVLGNIGAAATPSPSAPAAPTVPQASSPPVVDAAGTAAVTPPTPEPAKVEPPQPAVDVSKIPISGEQAAMANADLTKAATANNPGDAIRGTPPGSEIVEDIDDAIARRDKAAELPEFGFTNLDDHPPLKPGDKIQGPNDRANRDPTPAELEYGRRVLNEGDLSDEEKAQLESFKPVVIDPPIDKNAPPDVPADPRKVAESRGMVFAKKEDKKA